MSGALRNRPVTNRDPWRYYKRERRRVSVGWLYVAALTILSLAVMLN